MLDLFFVIFIQSDLSSKIYFEEIAKILILINQSKPLKSKLTEWKEAET